MSWKLPGLWRDYANLKTFADFADIFDPRQNKAVPAPDTSFLVSDYEALIKAFYSLDNIRDNRSDFSQMYWPIWNEAEKQKVWAALENIFEGNFWYLYYCGIEFGRNNSPQVTMYRYGVSGGNETQFYYGNKDEYFNSDRPITDPEVQEQFKAKVKLYADTIQKLWTKHKDKHYHTGNFQNNGWSQWNLFFKMLTNQKYMNLKFLGGTPASYDVFSALLQDHPNVKIKYSNVDGRNSLVATELVTTANRRPLYNVHQYTTNVCDLIDYPIIMDGEYNPLLMGVELELSTNYSCQQLVDAAEIPFFVIKSDASVNGNKRHMYELVTVPMSFKAQKRQWAKLFSNLNYMEFDTTNKTNNGMHVHLDKTAFHGISHIRNFCWFINNPANREFMLALSERDRSSYEKYSKNFDIPFGYNKGKSLVEATRLAATVRGATNVHKKGKTIEVRLFRGIVGFASVMKNLEATQAIFDYTAKAPLNSLGLNHFLKWLWSTPRNQYGVFKKFVMGLDLADLIAASEVLDCIFTEQDPDAIVKVLEHKKFPVTNAHITYLNRVRKKRTFVFNKATLKVEVITRDKAKLSSFDVSLQNRYAG